MVICDTNIEKACNEAVHLPSNESWSQNQLLGKSLNILKILVCWTFFAKEKLIANKIIEENLQESVA